MFDLLLREVHACICKGLRVFVDFAVDEESPLLGPYRLGHPGSIPVPLLCRQRPREQVRLDSTSMHVRQRARQGILQVFVRLSRSSRATYGYVRDVHYGSLLFSGRRFVFCRAWR